MDDPELAALQAALLTALGSAPSPESALELLSEAPLSEANRRWIERSDPRALQTAFELVRRWTEPLPDTEAQAKMDGPPRAR